MLKKILNLCLLTILISFIAGATGWADALPEEKTSHKPEKETTNITNETKEPDPKETVADKETADSEKANKDKPQGPSYPFVHENSDDEHLACKVTPLIEPKFANTKPIKKGNNLLRKPGSPSRAAGDYIQINGMVVDENCIPIQGAVIEIWQTDTLGHYEWEYDSESYWELPLAGKDNNFLFSGSAHTDNFGAFDFITIFPAAKDEEAPYINVIVKRAGYEELHTRLYFAGQPLNYTDKVLSSLKEDSKASITPKAEDIDPNGTYEGKAYYFPITMRGISPYKRF